MIVNVIYFAETFKSTSPTKINRSWMNKIHQNVKSQQFECERGFSESSLACRKKWAVMINKINDLFLLIKDALSPWDVWSMRWHCIVLIKSSLGTTQCRRDIHCIYVLMKAVVSLFIQISDKCFLKVFLKLSLCSTYCGMTTLQVFEPCCISISCSNLSTTTTFNYNMQHTYTRTYPSRFNLFVFYLLVFHLINQENQSSDQSIHQYKYESIRLQWGELNGNFGWINIRFCL